MAARAYLYNIETQEGYQKKGGDFAGDFATNGR
jgi:hypothetical protein